MLPISTGLRTVFSTSHGHARNVANLRCVVAKHGAITPRTMSPGFRSTTRAGDVAVTTSVSPLMHENQFVGGVVVGALVGYAVGLLVGVAVGALVGYTW